MLIPVQVPIIKYTYTGVNVFSIPYTFYGLSTIYCQVGTGAVDDSPTDLTPNIDYTVVGHESEQFEGTQIYQYGTLTLTNAGKAKIAIGDIVVIYRDTPVAQRHQYNELDNFPAKSHENALGKLAVVCQEILATLLRAVVLPPFTTESPTDLINSIFAARDAAEAAAVLAEISRTASEMAQSVAEEAVRNALDNWNKIRIIYATAETVSWLEEAAASLNNETGELHFKIPAGEPGPPGEVPALDIIDCGHAYQTQVLVIDCGQAVQNT